MSASVTLTIAFLGGLVPALVWLWFWRHEDTKNPEPRRFIFLAFLAGMLAVPIVIPLQGQAQHLFAGSALATMGAWAAIEEVAKFFLVGAAVLWRKVVDEPIDVVLYMISAALGFAALENVLFISNTFSTGGTVASILTGNLRFIGAMLLHTLASATIAVPLAFAFYKSWTIRFLAGTVGLILAIVLHTAFNLSIIITNGEHLFPIFLGVWTGIIALLLLFERIKRIKQRPTTRR